MSTLDWRRAKKVRESVEYLNGIIRANNAKTKKRKLNKKNNYTCGIYDNDLHIKPDNKEYNSAGYNENGFDRYGYDYYGFDKNGYNSAGLDVDGFNRNGYNRSGHKKQI